MENIELEHSGIKGMRWGIRRFQYKDGSLTPEGAKRYGSGDGRTDSGKSTKVKPKKVSRKVRKRREAALEKARQAKVEKKLHEEEKQKAIKSGSASDVLKFKSELTPQEMQAVWSRLQWEQNVSGLAAKEVSAGKKKVAKLMSNLETATTHVNTIAKTWNTIANIHNAFNVDGKLMPKIDTNITNGNRKEVKADKKERAKAEEARKEREAQEAQRESKHQERAEKRAKQEAEQKQKEAEQQKQTEAKTKQSKKEPEVERYEATGDDIIGEGKSKFTGWDKSSKNTSRSTNDDIIDSVVTSERTVTDLPSIEVSSGRNYINSLLLEDKSK